MLTMFMLSGCVKVSSVCPTFPVPEQEVVEMVQDLGSEAVDSWMVELYKLQLKLEECR